MGILTLDKWLDTTLAFYRLTLIVCGIAFRIVLTILVIHIHRTEDIRLAIQFCTLILTRTTIVVSLHPVVSLLEVRTIASLVAKTPHDNTWVVLISNHITLLTLDMCFLEISPYGKCLLLVAHTVTLKVTLCCKVKTILVAKVIPTRIIRIMTCTYGIDIKILHNLDILNHAIYRNDISAIRIQLMAVSTLYKNRLSVDEQLSSLDSDITETDLLTDSLQHIVAFLQLEL